MTTDRAAMCPDCVAMTPHREFAVLKGEFTEIRCMRCGHAYRFLTKDGEARGLAMKKLGGSHD